MWRMRRGMGKGDRWMDDGQISNNISFADETFGLSGAKKKCWQDRRVEVVFFPHILLPILCVTIL